MTRPFKKPVRPMRTNKSAPTKRDASTSASDLIKRIKERQAQQTEGFDYRRASLALHGPVCARCGRSFEGKDLPLLTVHHKDGNAYNNPRDGSNWENLCVYCHDDIHAREHLAETIGLDNEPEESRREDQASSMVSLADKLKAALKEK